MPKDLSTWVDHDIAARRATTSYILQEARRRFLGELRVNADQVERERFEEFDEAFWTLTGQWDLKDHSYKFRCLLYSVHAYDKMRKLEYPGGSEKFGSRAKGDQMLRHCQAILNCLRAPELRNRIDAARGQAFLERLPQLANEFESGKDLLPTPTDFYFQMQNAIAVLRLANLSPKRLRQGKNDPLILALRQIAEFWNAMKFESGRKSRAQFNEFALDCLEICDLPYPLSRLQKIPAKSILLDSD